MPGEYSRRGDEGIVTHFRGPPAGGPIFQGGYPILDKRDDAEIDDGARPHGTRARSAAGFLVTWDIDSRDQRAVDRVRHFVFGRRVRSRGRAYSYPGFVFQDGVRYLGQSALFVVPARKSELCAFLQALAVDHEAIPAALD